MGNSNTKHLSLPLAEAENQRVSEKLPKQGRHHPYPKSPPNSRKDLATPARQTPLLEPAEEAAHKPTCARARYTNLQAAVQFYQNIGICTDPHLEEDFACLMYNTKKFTSIEPEEVTRIQFLIPEKWSTEGLEDGPAMMVLWIKNKKEVDTVMDKVQAGGGVLDPIPHQMQRVIPNLEGIHFRMFADQDKNFWLLFTITSYWKVGVSLVNGSLKRQLVDMEAKLEAILTQMERNGEFADMERKFVTARKIRDRNRANRMLF